MLGTFIRMDVLTVVWTPLKYFDDPNSVFSGSIKRRYNVRHAANIMIWRAITINLPDLDITAQSSNSIWTYYIYNPTFCLWQQNHKVKKITSVIL